MHFAYELEARVSDKWHHARQMGIDHAVLISGPGEAFPFWDYMQFAALKRRFDDFGLKLAVLEVRLPFDRIREGLPGRDDDIDLVCRVIRNMGELGIPVLCYNWMARIGWLRNSFATPARGGAVATGYDHALTLGAPVQDDSLVPEELLWETLAYFLARVVPVAEKAGVKLALHPDDPPLSPIAGVGRIMGSVEAFERALALVESEANGITFCQGNFALMPGDLIRNIHRLAATGRMHFVHFRNLRGTAENFVETFHDDGQIDMLAAMRAYADAGFDGYMRCDHVPEMAGDRDESEPGYGALGKLYAIGYMKGLLAGAEALSHRSEK